MSDSSTFVKNFIANLKDTLVKVENTNPDTVLWSRPTVRTTLEFLIEAVVNAEKQAEFLKSIEPSPNLPDPSPSILSRLLTAINVHPYCATEFNTINEIIEIAGYSLSKSKKAKLRQGIIEAIVSVTSWYGSYILVEDYDTTLRDIVTRIASADWEDSNAAFEKDVLIKLEQSGIYFPEYPALNATIEDLSIKYNIPNLQSALFKLAEGIISSDTWKEFIECYVDSLNDVDVEDDSDDDAIDDEEDTLENIQEIVSNFYEDDYGFGRDDTLKDVATLVGHPVTFYETFRELIADEYEIVLLSVKPNMTIRQVIESINSDKVIPANAAELAFLESIIKELSTNFNKAEDAVITLDINITALAEEFNADYAHVVECIRNWLIRTYDVHPVIKRWTTIRALHAAIPMEKQS